MGLEGRKIAITGAGRGLGAALAIVAADRGMKPLLLGRTMAALEGVADAIKGRTGMAAEAIECDLADTGSVADAAARISRTHGDLDILVNSGAQWSSGALEALSDEEVAGAVNSMLTGTIALTRRLLPILRARPNADIHTVVSMSGLPYARMRGASAAFVAAKAGQAGFVQALTEEMSGTPVRVTATYPGMIDDVSPLEDAWNSVSKKNDKLNNRNVVEAILYILEQPENVSIRTLVIERTETDFLD